MLQLVDESLEAFLRAEVPLDPTDVAISFDAPDKTWAATVTQPTINLFLWDIHRSPEKARAGMETVAVNGKTARRRPPPVVNLCYVLTAWTAHHRDEHQLLGELMQTILGHRYLEPPYLRAPLDALHPLPTLNLGGVQTEFWKSIDGVLKPGLELQVSLVVDAATLRPTEEPPAEVSVTTSDTREGGQSHRTALADRDEGRLVARRGSGVVEIADDEA
ncbi:MAG TPA: DUF4255 domain-containing protein [Acidimicrobiales bacterium]|nr:DUF4255 domain-containing protein [Acidimicrobiales bacterium]